MSGEIDYRRYCSSYSGKPEFLTDELSNKYCGWQGTATIQRLTTNLPPERGVRAKLKITRAGGLYGYLLTTIPMRSAPQNLRGYRMDFWIRGDAPPIGVTIYFHYIDGGFYLYKGVLLSTVWQKFSLDIPKDFASSAPLFHPKDQLAQGASYFYFEATLATDFDFEVAGLTFRRL